ncbi:MAG: YkgJ family cysteine cluster protein [Methanolinea sp.]|nr:YkgJ family cysteine cluster protein [Methanolinea sp.]
MSEGEPSGLVERIAERIRGIGFSCTLCGDCCRGFPDDNNLVMVSPSEIRCLSETCLLARDEIAEPYPESIALADGTNLTLGWAIRRVQGECRFFRNGSCIVYESRPWICRTYPFMLDGETLLVFPCRGLGGSIGRKEALSLARDLVSRKVAEDEEEEKIRKVLISPLPKVKGRLIVDSDGVTVL